jgi:hypothetical protein
MPHRTFNDPSSIEARQALLDGRCERSHPKRHRTAKRKSRAASAKQSAGKHRAAVNAAAARHVKDKAASYWRGELDEHP